MDVDVDDVSCSWNRLHHCCACGGRFVSPACVAVAAAVFLCFSRFDVFFTVLCRLRGANRSDVRSSHSSHLVALAAHANMRSHHTTPHHTTRSILHPHIPRDAPCHHTHTTRIACMLLTSRDNGRVSCCSHDPLVAHQPHTCACACACA